MSTIPSAENINRLALSIMQKYNIDYTAAIEKLNSLKLRIICGPRVINSSMKQIALITTVNCGVRAFLGGVSVLLPNSPGPILNQTPLQGDFLTDVLTNFGSKISSNHDSSFEGFTLFIDHPADSDMSLELVSNSWQGGVVPYGYAVSLTDDEQLPLGAIASAAIGVGAAFFRLTGMEPHCVPTPRGVSLWDPGANWIDAPGQPIYYLPEKLWVLGLGHLGQAFLWNYALLPFSRPDKIQIMLQDTQEIANANYSAGLLTQHADVDIKKTMVARHWLSSFGFKTFVTERKFDQHTVRADKEPHIAVCGFDNAASRQLLENAGFDLVVEAGLGGQLHNFDDILIHSFPSKNHSAQDLWKAADLTAPLHQHVLDHFNKIDEKAVCGMLAENIASKAISTSFVGALAGAFVIAEIVRAANCCSRYDYINAQIRNLVYLKGFQEGSYGIEAAQNGLVEVKS